MNAIQFGSDLAAAFDAAGTPMSDATQKAFQSVDRLAFVEGFFDRHGPQWTWVSGAEARDLVYSDRSLVTDFDPLTNAPSSSSTMPSLMAAMLDALDVQPGLHVLEVGTGTGYNAALLSKLVGPRGSVFTTEPNASVAARARERLVASGIDNVTVVETESAVVDRSSAGHAFDRLIATVGCSQVPPSWWDAMQTTAAAVVPLRCGYWHPVVKIAPKVGVHDAWRGRFLMPANFMPAVGPVIGREREPLPLRDLTRIDSGVATGKNSSPIDFELFALLQAPDIFEARDLDRDAPCIALESADGSTAATSFGQLYRSGGNEFGMASLRLSDLQRRWHSLDCPTIDAYAIELSPQHKATKPALENGQPQMRIDGGRHMTTRFSHSAASEQFS